MTKPAQSGPVGEPGGTAKSPVQSSLGPQERREATPDWTVHCRPPTARDVKYIRDTWLSSYRNSPYAGVIPNNLYDDVYGETIDQLILRGLKFVVVANPANPELMLGWLAYEVAWTTSGEPQGSSPRPEYVVHFLFVKPTYRRLGISSQVLASVGISGSFFYTFRTGSSKYLKGGRYRPEIARRKSFGPESIPMTKPELH